MSYWGLCTECRLVRYSAASQALETCPVCGAAMQISDEMPRRDEVEEVHHEPPTGRFSRRRRGAARRRG